ncbi:tetratricopeptide repeat protein [Streptomyces sp. 6N223]|uniref:tetratricopeptide repeat protein n=1 Tax=Streptomyces sp. 6N223 TaxID=3457412 RepID=UPI003FD50221
MTSDSRDGRVSRGSRGSRVSRGSGVSSEDWDRRVEALWDEYDAYERLGDEAGFRAAMARLVAEFPDEDPVGLFEMASAYDSTDGEAEAADHYRRALAAGLGEADTARRDQAVIQFASTLRNLGRPEESIALLRLEDTREEGNALGDAVAAFLALALTDAGREREAVSLLLDTLAPHLPRYQRSVRNYAAALLPPGS